MHEQHGIRRDRLPVEEHEPEEKRFERDDIGVRNVSHQQARYRDADQKSQHHVV
jgi:hypothetical protein